MNESQILQICITATISIVLPLSFLMLSNSRISDAKETLRAEMALLRAEMNARFDKVEARFEKMDARMERMQDALLERMGDIEMRLQRLEPH